MTLKFKKLEEIIREYKTRGCFIKKIDDKYKIFLEENFSRDDEFDFYEFAHAGQKKEVQHHFFDAIDVNSENPNKWIVKFGHIQHYSLINNTDECFPEFVFENVKEKLDLILENK